MILYWIFSFILATASAVLAIFPKVTELPFGDAALATAFGYWYSFLEVMWPLEDIWVRVLWYVGFLSLLMTARFFFGSRISKYDTDIIEVDYKE